MCFHHRPLIKHIISQTVQLHQFHSKTIPLWSSVCSYQSLDYIQTRSRIWGDEGGCFFFDNLWCSWQASASPSLRMSLSVLLSVLFHPLVLRRGHLSKQTAPCWLQRWACWWGWVWPRCELSPALCLNICSLNSSPLPLHLYAPPPRPPPSLPSSSSSTPAWSCPSRSSKPLDPGSCSGCSGSLWCDRLAHAPPLALAPPLRLWPGSKPAPAGYGMAWSR